jgi:probable HAF family extracellular repeat protein
VIICSSDLTTFLTFRAIFWDNGTPTVLGTLPGSCGLSINNRGQVVGSASVTINGMYQGHAILWNNGTTVDPGTLPGG